MALNLGNMKIKLELWLTAVSEAQWIEGLLQWKIGYKLQKFYLNSKRLLVFFVWSKMVQGSLRLPVLASKSILSGPEGVQGPFYRPFWILMPFGINKVLEHYDIVYFINCTSRNNQGPFATGKIRRNIKFAAFWCVFLTKIKVDPECW